MIHFFILLFSLFYSGRAQQSTLYPPAIPLAVRSPYLSCWMFTLKGTNLADLWPTTSDHIPNNQYQSINSLNIPVVVRVDNTIYSLLGYPFPINNVTSNLANMVVTPTQTQLTAQAGPMQFNLTFLNPIEPGDWVMQSIPFSYMSLTATSLDGAPHAVQVYSDMSAEWLSADRTQLIVWNTTPNDDVIYHTVKLKNPSVFNEVGTQPEWGTLHFAMKSSENLTYKISEHNASRLLFQSNGALDNQTDMNYRTIDPNYTVFAISRDLGTIQATQDPIVWAVGFTVDPAINYIDLSGVPHQRSLFFKTQYSGDTPLIVDFLNNFTSASSRALALDSKILQHAASISSPLADLVSLATAQIYGSIQVTVGTDKSGNLDKSDVMAFMKNVGGSKTNRVNAVETLYSAFPAFLYIDPKLAGLLLDPLFRLQASPNPPNPYSAPDLGMSYPNATVNNATHNQGVEQSANMLIMTYAHARTTGDGEFIGKYYDLLTSWANYLSDSALLIHDQSSADGLPNSNQTNLAIKGIIAIKAMSKMSAAVKLSVDVDKYSGTATSLYAQWKVFALAGDEHLLATYGQTDSWTLGYNLYADIWLDTGVVESSVYDGQSNFINNLVTTSTFSNFGMPVDNISSDTTSAFSSWSLFAAAMTPNQDLRANLISRVHNRANHNLSVGVFPTEYDSTNGPMIQGGASPAQGAMYAPLALNISAVQITAKLTKSTKSHAGAIAGGIIGSLAALLAIVLVMWCRRRRSGSVMPHIYSPKASSLLAEDVPLNGGLQTDWRQWQVEQFPHPLSFPESSPFLLPSEPIPPGLSDKELAQIRTSGHNSSSANSRPSMSSISVTADADALRGAAAEASSSTTEAQRLRSEVDILRQEVHQLLAGTSEAPPTYVSGEDSPA